MNDPAKTATTAEPLHPLLAERWSPRAFDPEHQLTERQTTALLEAARWAPSAGNSQPWRFAVAHRGTPRTRACSTRWTVATRCGRTQPPR